MKIRSKLAWTFIVLLIVGIMGICSYAIVFIKNYMEQKGRIELEQDTHWLAVTVANLPPTDQFELHFNETAQTSGYHLALYDSAGILLDFYPKDASPAHYLPADQQQVLETRGGVPWMPVHKKSDRITSYIYMPASINKARYIKISQFKDQIYAPVKKIRWIIYYGIFASILLVALVSFWIARYLTKPITQIKDAAREIAGGDIDRQINLNRQDEFGTLADSLNRMATKLREDTEQIKRYAEKQRQFFADITHEVRNPLHTITGSLEMLALEDLPAGKREKYRRNAENQVARINRLFKDLVTLQRYDSDEYFIEKRPFDLAHIARHMQEWHSQKAHEKGLTLQIDTQKCRTLGDPDKIEQVIDNLVSNAIKYTKAGKVILSYNRVDGNVRIQVRDTGIGISQEHWDRLFDRFYRTDKARSRDKGGTGLGLSVVRSILNAHGSKIYLKSSPGKGSVFRFELPAVD